ncbi:MAG: CoA-binding protein [Candidatus Daviesbacteria bacterium]|nr:CoA-binding protein [Candidatus Daviesbacteria bacterium]
MKLPSKDAKILGQGITGSEGSRAVPWMKAYGTNIVAGVTPGKGGQEVEGVPIFNSVKEAIEAVGSIDVAVQFVPPKFMKSAAIEAIEAGIGLHIIQAEKVPTQDASYIVALALERGVNILGPNTAGMISPSRKLKLGLVGGGNPSKMFIPGNIAVISKSGSMAAEISLSLKSNGFGVSWAVGIGGDRIIGSDFVDMMLALEEDAETKAYVIFGELGGTYEERVAEYIQKGKIKKPVVAFIAGEFTQILPSEVQFGHAGAIIEGSRGRPDHKRQVLREAGVKVADNFDEIADLVKALAS